MQIDEKWYNLYKQLYGETFNRLLTIGSANTGFHNHPIKNINELREEIEKSGNQTEFYISLYDYKTDENILKWDARSLEKYEKYSYKEWILFRFKQNTQIIKEETKNLNEIQKFMFIRRSINLGCNKTIVNECYKVYNFFKSHFNVKGILMFNGFDECLLYYHTNDLSLKNPSSTYYNICKLIEEKLKLTTLIYQNIAPYGQIVPLPGTQNNYSRLYTQIYYPDFSYAQIMKKGQEKLLDENNMNAIENSEQLEEFIQAVDNEITTYAKPDFDSIWNGI